MNLRLLVPLIVIAAAWCGSLAADEPGTLLVYEAQQPKFTDAATAARDVEQVVKAIKSRLRGAQIDDARVWDRGENRIEVLVPGNDAKKVDRVARLVASPGTLEFRILANRHDHQKLIDRAEKDSGAVLKDAKGKRLAWWVPVAAGQKDEFRRGGDIATRQSKEKGGKGLEVLVVEDRFDVTGRYLERAAMSVGPSGRPGVDFNLTAQGGKLFGNLTGSNLPDETTGFARRLGIILDGRLFTAPNLHGTIHDRGQITGNFNKQEVEDLVAVLDAGSMPVPIKQISKSTVNLKH